MKKIAAGLILVGTLLVICSIYPWRGLEASMFMRIVGASAGFTSIMLGRLAWIES
jgi:hypothetical protein